ncbi:MAG: TIGR00266 family protein [Alphaproteobacteria bacterium]|nr:TIGR00266 family protein [Alphaproteobacteria bacterium]
MTTQTSEFVHSFEGRPEFSLVRVTLPAGRTIKAEASAMVTMDTNVSMKTRLKGGFRRFLGGESLFINEFAADRFPGEVSFAAGLPGDMHHVHLNGETVYLQNGAFLAAGAGVDVSAKWQGMIKGFFSGAGFFLVKCSGTGDLFFASYGGILEIDVKDGYTIDTKHVVGFSEGLEYKIGKFAGYKSFFFSGEGLVAKFSGSGKLWIQTRSAPSFVSWIWPFRPVRQRNNNN